MIIEAKDNNDIIIGRLGENEARRIEFPVGNILREFPDATFSVLHKRPGDAGAYPVSPGNIELDENKLYWEIKSGDLANVGVGQCQVCAYEDNAIVKTIIYRTKILEALDDSGEVPEPWESWVTDVAGYAAEAQEAAEDAEAWAVGKRDGTDVGSSDPAYHNNAKYYSGQASSSASDAAGAKTAAETAKGKAEDAQTAAETAQGKAEDAQEAAETAQGKAEDAQEAAETAQGKAEDAQEAAEAARDQYPKIDSVSGNWETYDPEEEQYVDTGVHAQGDTGNTGATPEISIGTVTTLQPDQQAYVTLDPSSTPEAPVLNFGLVKGDTGQAGNVYGNTIDMSSSDSTKVSAAINAKAAKVTSATNGHLAALDSNGDLTDSGKAASDFATKVTGGTENNFAGLDANGNIKDSGKAATDFKAVQTAVSDPSASGTTDQFIATISQDANGVITPTKKTVQDATQSVHGLMSASDKSKLDNISQATDRTVAVAVAVADWTLSGGVYTAEFTTAYVTSTSKECLVWDRSYESYAKAYITVNKKTGGGGLILETTVIPTGTITGTLSVLDNDDGKIPVIIEGTTVPIANGGTGQSSVAGVKAAFDIPEVVNNLTTNDGTKALSAAQGYALNTNMTSYVTGNPTSITLTPNTSYCSIISSYVYKLGRVVTVGLMIKFTATPPADTAYFISGFPIPNADVLVSCMKRNGGACYSCVLTQAGALRNEWQALPASQDCMFNFTYMASSLS